MAWTPISVFLLFGLGASVLALARIYSGRSERARSIARRLYMNQASMIWQRNGLAVVPVVAPGILLFGTLALLPRPIGQLLISPTFILIFGAFLASYRVPAPFLMRWLRKEIEDGVTPVATPSRWDWVVLAIVAPIAAVGIVLVPIYFLQYGTG